MEESCAVFEGVKAGTQFIVDGQRYVKLSPHGREICECSLARLSDGVIVYATELWNMQERREKRDIAFCWEKDKMLV